MRQRLDQLREILAKADIEALLITDKLNRRYVTGLTGTAGYALVTADRAKLITDFRYLTQAREQAPDFDIVDHENALWQTISDLCRKLGVQQLAFEKEHVSFSQYEQLRDALDRIELIPTEPLVENLRMVKNEDELNILQKAADIADQTYEHILTVLRPGMTEREVELELEFSMRELGATSSSFDTIVASGKRSALPHGTATDKVIEQGDFVTLDFGALYDGYCSDITRTVVIGEASPKQREIYDIVLTAQKRGIAQLKPGMTGKEADDLTRDVIQEKGYGDYFGHGTGHGIGLDVHEGPRLSPKGKTVLKPGMVVTVEPGIYLPDFGGVRIEDDVVVTSEGCQRLTNSSKAWTVV